MLKHFMSIVMFAAAGLAVAAKAPFVQIAGAAKNVVNTCKGGGAAPLVPVNIEIPAGASFTYAVAYPSMDVVSDDDYAPSAAEFLVPFFTPLMQNGPVVGSNAVLQLPSPVAWYTMMPSVIDHTTLALVVRTYSGTGGNGELVAVSEFEWDCTTGDGFAVFNDLNALGAVPTALAKTAAVEFYHASLDHYFITSNATEIADLDSGRTAGWTRTGGTFGIFAGAVAEASPVCRFYIPPGLGNSHFYSASPAECATVLAGNPSYSYESPSIFYVMLPNATTGACPLLSTPVYRLWNQRSDSNHRYTADPAIKAQMIARGYVAEGYGPDAVIMCAPS